MEYENIYIDNDDDITSVVDKVAKSKKNSIKLVPPKRIGFLQSAVSMKLIKRTARKFNKDIVIVTVDPVLSNLAAMAGVMVARGLKAEPELLEVDEPEDTDETDEIDGKSYLGGDGKNPKDKDIEVELRQIDDEIDGEDEDDTGEGKKKNLEKKAPNFAKFRKWLFLGGGLTTVLAVFLVWALVFAPQATITIYAKTTSEKVQKNVTLGDSLVTDSGVGTIKTTTKQEKRDDSVEVEATGQRDIGEVAKGVVSITTNSATLSQAGLAAGATVTLNGKQFVTQEAVSFVVDPTTDSFIATNVPIAAQSNGETYNITDGAGNVAGANATVAGSTSGGTTKLAKVVTEVDVRSARDKIKGEVAENIKSDMTSKFGDEYVVIQASFKSQVADPVAAPALGEVTDSGKFKLTVTTTYTLVAINKDEIKNFTKKILEEKAESLGGQKIYDYGENKASLNSFVKPEGGDVATGVLVTSGKLGPVIDSDDVIRDMAGKRIMEVKAILEKKNGVTRVDVDMFFTSTVPADPNKVTVRFEPEE